MKALLLNVCLLLASLLLLAGALETVARMWPGERESHLDRNGSVRYRFNPFRPDDRVSYALRPDWETGQQHKGRGMKVVTNVLGLRGKPAAAQKAQGVLRVLVVGDSFTFGLGVAEDETLPAALEPLLRAQLGQPVEVLNAGVPGWAADDYLVFLEERGFDLAPDLVVVVVMENDPGDLLWKRFDLDEDRLPLRTRSILRVVDPNGQLRYMHDESAQLPDAPFPDIEFLARRSLFYHWIRFRVLKTWYQRAEVRAAGTLATGAGVPPEGPIESLDAAEIERGLRTGPAFQLRYHRHLVAGIEREATRRGIPVFWVLAARRETEAANAGNDLHADCRDLGARCLDTLDLFPAEEKDRYFLEGDHHWSADGCARVAEALAVRLTPILSATREAAGATIALPSGSRPR
jgi:lysophospholipase L1-like esterase